MTFLLNVIYTFNVIPIRIHSSCIFLKFGGKIILEYGKINTWEYIIYDK